MYFYINREHLFNSISQVLRWTKRAPLQGDFTPELNGLIARMLDPDPDFRPTSREVWNETVNDNRQAL